MLETSARRDRRFPRGPPLGCGLGGDVPTILLFTAVLGRVSKFWPIAKAAEFRASYV